MLLRFTFRQLEYMVAVGDLGSIALASQKINVSSPSISAAISQLEAEFGAQLFVRQHAQGLTLTAVGQHIFDEAKQILNAAAALNNLANDITSTVRGPICVGALTTIAPLLSASVKRSFETAHPDVDLSLREGNQTDLLHMLGRADIDIAITYDLEIPKDISFLPLAELPPLVMLPRAHALAAKAKVSLKDLQAEPMILLDLPLSREYFLSIFQSAGYRPQIAERTGELSVARSLVANGFGFGLLNFRTPSDTAPDGEQLAIRPLAGDFRPMILGLATKRSEHRTQTLNAFQEHIKARIDENDLPGMGKI